MDTLRLLSRGLKTKARQSVSHVSHVPSAEAARPRLFSEERPAKKRRIDDNATILDNSIQTDNNSSENADTRLSECQTVLSQHKIKVTRLQPPSKAKKSKRSSGTSKLIKTSLYPAPLSRFEELESQCGVPARLARNVQRQGYTEPTEVQMAGIPLLCRPEITINESGGNLNGDPPHLLSVAPTGSGKTLAFLIPTISRLLQDSSEQHATRCLILAPTKELVAQIVNEGKILLQGTALKTTAYRKDMRLDGEGVSNTDNRTVAKPDILVSTPGALSVAVDEATTHLAQVCYLILDEADVLLDPLFREQTVKIWKSLSSSNLRVSLWSATMGSNIENLVLSLIQEHAEATGAASLPLVRLVVGLKDSAVPNVQHRLIYAATEQGKLMGLRQLLHPSTSTSDPTIALRPPFIVFTQTIERAIALHAELLYDIPTEAGGSTRIAVLHSDLSDSARSDIMTRFRRGEVWVLITTDLLSRGIDFRGVNGVVNYDIPSSSAAYVHRAGRTGRAGRDGGVAVTLYSKEDIPYLKHIANVIAAAQREGKVETDGGVQQWLLDALPALSKNEKQRFKKHGIEARTSKANSTSSKAARDARISTKPGFIRRSVNNRKGAIEASRRRKAQQEQDDSNTMDFSGFD